MDNIEEFCQNCDSSSLLVSGEYIENVWYCDKCAVETKKPQYVTQRYASEHIKKLLKELSDD